MPIYCTVLLIAVVAIILAHAAIVRLALRMFEYAPPLNAEESEPDPRGEVVYFPNTQHETLSAALFRAPGKVPRGLILFCHELSADKWSAMSYCEGLWQAGFDILSLDFRSHGKCEPSPELRSEPMHWLTTNEVDDVQSALRFISEHLELSKLPLGVLGISRGGGAALVASALNDQVKAVCVDGAYTTHSMTHFYARRWLTLFVPAWLARLIPAWHVSMTIGFAWRLSQRRRRCRYVRIEKSLPLLSNRPVLLISGKRDTYVRPEITKGIYDGIGGEERSLWIVPEAKHNQARSVATAHYDERVVEFFSVLSEASDSTAIDRQKSLDTLPECELQDRE